MAMSNTDKLSEREEIEALLPWFVTGKLDSADVKKVAAYLAAHADMDAELARRLALIREEQAETQAAHETLKEAPAGAFGRFMQSMEKAAPQTRSMKRRRALAGRLSEVWRGFAELFEAPSPAAVRWAAVAVVTVLTIQSVIIATLAIRPGHEGGAGAGNDYRLAGGTKPSAKGGAAFLVTFARSATARQITTFLTEFDAVIVDGPKPGGMYRVIVRRKTLSPDVLLKRFSERRDMVELVLPAGS
jgi:hypothetical protein